MVDKLSTTLYLMTKFLSILAAYHLVYSHLVYKHLVYCHFVHTLYEEHMLFGLNQIYY
jgi:hypothetical protein